MCIGIASKNSCATTTVNSSSLFGTSLTLPHHLVSTPPNPVSSNFFFCTSRRWGDDSTRWIDVTGGDDEAGSERNVCGRGGGGVSAAGSGREKPAKARAYAEDVGEEGAAAWAELDDAHLRRGTLLGPLGDVPDGEQLRGRRAM